MGQAFTQDKTSGSAAARGDEEIAKKDLLQEMGITYGQFYRWKRMGLIPEAWFRRRSTFTGQETFLPRQQIMERIRRIQELKDRYSLDELALMFSPDAVRRGYGPEELESMSWVSQRALAVLRAISDGAGSGGRVDFTELLCLELIEHLLRNRAVSQPQVALAAQTFLQRSSDLDPAGGGAAGVSAPGSGGRGSRGGAFGGSGVSGGGGAERRLLVAQRGDATFVALHTGACVFDSGTTVIAEADLGRLAEDLKVRLRERMM